MITPDEIRLRADKVYVDSVTAWLRGDEDFFPHRLRVNLDPPEPISEAIELVTRLRQHSKEVIGFGYSVQWEARKSRKFGNNLFPIKVFFESMQDLVGLVGKLPEFEAINQAWEEIRQRQPIIAEWFVNNWQKALEILPDISDLISVVDFMTQNPWPGIYVREIPLPISTKLIECNEKLLIEWLIAVLPPSAIEHKENRSFARRFGFREPQSHFLIRVLDSSLLAELGLTWPEMSVPLECLCQLPAKDLKVIFVENKITLLTLPLVHRGIAFGGLGKAVNQLFEIPWLDSQTITYWGDIDVEGFEILASVRKQFRSCQSIMMNGEVVERYCGLATLGNLHPLDLEPYSELTQSESVAFRYCRDHQSRLEQEHLPQSWVNEVFQKAMQ